MSTLSLTELKQDVGTLVGDVIPLAEAHPCPDSGTPFLRLLEAVLRRNLMRVQAVLALCNIEGKLADSAMEITRNIIEDVVSVEYILAKDPEEYTKRFQAFRWVQLKEDLDYYMEAKVSVDDETFPNTSQDIENGYQKAIKDFPDFVNEHTGKPRRSWANRDIEQMLSSSDLQAVLGSSQISTLVRTYTDGSRKTHFNPLEILTLMEQDTWDMSTQKSQRLSLLVSSSSLVRITTRYIDEISSNYGENTFHDIGGKANAFLEKLQGVDILSND